MAMVIEEEAERAARSPANVSSSSKATETSAIYREVLGEIHSEQASSSSPSSPTKSTSSKDGQRTGTPFGQPQRRGHGNRVSSVNDSRATSAASGNPWIIMLGRERTTSTIRSGISGPDTHVENRNVHQYDVTTACFQGKQVNKKSDKSQSRTERFESQRRNWESSAKHGNENGRVSLSNGRAVNLTFQQSTDPTVTTFVNHFQHNQLPDRLLRRSNLKHPFIADRAVGGLAGILDTPKSVTFRRNRFHLEAGTQLREAVKERTVANTIGVQAQTAIKAGNGKGSRDRKQEEAVKVYRSTRKTGEVPREFSDIRRQRRPPNPIKRRPVGKPPVTLSRKPIKAAKGKPNPQKQERSAATTTAKMSGRPSTASLQDTQNCIEEATVKGSCSCSRTKGNRNVDGSENDDGDMAKLPRRFSTSDEGYDTTHSIEGDSNKKLPDIAPPIVNFSLRCLPETEMVTLSKTMKSLKLEKTNVC